MIDYTLIADKLAKLHGITNYNIQTYADKNGIGLSFISKETIHAEYFFKNSCFELNEYQYLNDGGLTITMYTNMPYSKLGKTDEYNVHAIAYWKNSARHREDGPAIEWAGGSKEWYVKWM